MSAPSSKYPNSFPRDIIYNPPIIPRIKVKPSWVLSKCPSEYDLGQEKEYRKCRFPKLVTFDLLSSGSSRGIPLAQCGSMLELVDGKDYVLSESPSEEITVGLYWRAYPEHIFPVIIPTRITIPEYELVTREYIARTLVDKIRQWFTVVLGDKEKYIPDSLVSDLKFVPHSSGAKGVKLADLTLWGIQHCTGRRYCAYITSSKP
ncbi:hypothetical protein ABKN59_003977 [Abortiporus biennis]